MALRGALLLFGMLLFINCASQQAPPKKRPAKKDVAKDTAVEELQKQIDNIVQELNILKEQQALQTVCLKGVKITGKCFLADALNKRYHTASEDCNALGGILSTPSSADENARLTEYVRQSVGLDAQIWLGINDMAAEGRWTNQTGLSVAYNNWDASNQRSPQPDGGRVQNCAALSTAAGGKWFDENCREEKPSVCQFNIV